MVMMNNMDPLEKYSKRYIGPTDIISSNEHSIYII